MSNSNYIVGYRPRLDCPAAMELMNCNPLGTSRRGNLRDKLEERENVNVGRTI